MRLLCIGDSNTYGFDPRSCAGESYPAGIRWTDVLASQTGWEIFNAGQNGRCVPFRPGEMEQLVQLIDSYGALDGCVIVLGSNDLLQGLDAEAIVMRMMAFLECIQGIRVFLVTPPLLRGGTWVTDAKTVQESGKLAGYYRNLAEQMEIPHVDAGEWGVETLFDGVHFSEAGHRSFASGIQTWLMQQQ